MEKLPVYSTDLITLLDEKFPLRNPSVHDDIASIQRAAGQRDVIEHLLYLKRIQDQNILETDT